MAGKQSVTGKVIVDYLKRYPKLPKKTLARLIVEKEPGLFTSVEACRKKIVQYTTESPSNRLRTDKYGTVREKGVSGADPWTDLMPKSWNEPIVPFKLPSSIRKLLVLCDIHVPFHDEQALTVAIEYGLAQNPDAVLLNGDTLDFYSMSSHENDPRKVKWKEELEAGRSFLRMIRQVFPGIPIYFKEGNHEFRLERHLMKHAQVLIGMDEFELPTLLGMGELGIEYIRNKRMVHAGDLTIGHGDEYKGSGGVNPARWLSLRTRESTLIGHFHRTSEHIERTVRGVTRGYWSVGCLSELDPQYLPYNDWCHGFAVIHINEDGSFEVDNRKIIKGVVR